MSTTPMFPTMAAQAMPDLRETPLGNLTESDLNALVTARAEESRTLDAKRDMYAPGGTGNREFLKDISAFANSAGGVLLIGVDEQSGIVSGVPGIDGDRDAIILRLRQAAEASIKPRIVGIEMQPIPLASGKFVIAVRVDRSWIGPHRVEAEDYRFYYRVERGIERFDVDQLRSAFLAGPEFARRAREYRAERVAVIAAGAGPIRLLDRSAVIVHVLPQDVFSGSRVTGARLRGELSNLFPPGAISVRDIRFNLEGVLGYTGDEKAAAAYSHISRFGAYEAVRSNIIMSKEHPDQPPRVSIGTIEKCVGDGVKYGLQVMKSLRRESPFTIFVSLVGVQGAHYAPVGFATDDAEVKGFDRDIVLVTDDVFSEIPKDEPELVRRTTPLLDEIANAAGWTQSPHRHGS